MNRPPKAPLSGKPPPQPDADKQSTGHKGVFDHLPVGILELDANGTIHNVNCTFADMVGEDQQKLLDQNILSILNQFYCSQVSDGISRALSGSPSRLDVEFMRGDGTTFWGEIRLQAWLDAPSAPKCMASVSDVTSCKQAEASLRKHGEQLSLAVKGTRIGLWDWYIQTGEITINDHWARLIGYTREELEPVTFATWAKYCHPDDLAESNRLLQEHFLGQTEYYECEVRMRHRDGHWVWVLDRGKLFERDAEGWPVRMSGTHQDITERKNKETQIQKSEELFRRIYENMAIGVARVSLGFIIEAANKAYCQMLGYTEEELVGKHLKDITHPEVVKENLRLQSLLAKGNIDHYRMEKSFFHKTGAIIHGILDANLVRDTQGKPIYVLGSVLDITEQKSIQKALEEAKDEFELIFENSQVGIMLLRGGRIFARGNKRLADILGYGSPEEMAGLSMRHIHLDEAAYNHFGDTYYSQLAHGERNQIEYQLRRKDGSPVWCILSGKALDPDNLERGVIWVLDNLEPRKALERALIKARDTAEDASRAKSEFLANMSHEIRTPLNGIMVMQQLLRRTSLDPDQKQYVETTIQSTSRLTRLLSDILDLSRVEAGKLELVEEPFEFNMAMDFVEQYFRTALKEKDLTLDVHVHPAIPGWLIGDQVRLLQVLYNLTGNALKFTRNGAISLEAYPLPSPGPGRYRILFSVEDSGVGMPLQTMEDLFEPFVQAEISYKRQYQGAGLGLSICKRLVNLMGGDISVASREGVGTAFQFCADFGLPEQADEPVRNDEAMDGQTLPKGLKVLLAEDEPVNRRGITLLLEMEGCEVAAVENGRQALDALRERDFDMVLMDVQMPVMDGVEATRAIRRGEAGQDRAMVPIVALTAYAMAGDKKIFLEAGMDGYVPKSVDEKELWKELVRVHGACAAKV